jgi:hypothetical protein
MSQRPDATLEARVRAHLAVEPEPWPEGDVDTIAELLRRAADRGAAGTAVAAELARAAAERTKATYDTLGFEAAIRAGHHLSLAAALMRRGWSQHERRAARDLALDLYDRAVCSPYPNTRAWAHLKSAHVLVDAGDPKEAWHHAQMAEFRPETPAAAAYYDQLNADLREKIKKASNDPSWLAAVLADYA